MKLHEMIKRNRVMPINRSLVVAFASAAGLAGQASAEPIDRGALEALFEEPVTLSATGAPQRVTDAPVNMTIITQEEIRRSGAVDLPGVLGRLAHVDVMRTSVGQVDVSIRGYNEPFSPRLLVLLNGRQVYLDDYGRTNWAAIPVQLGEIRQIEVVSGPNTALFGFNAVAGVVNIITYDALQDDVDQVMVRVGSTGNYSGSAIWTARPTENFGVRLSLGGFDNEASEGDDGVAQAFLGANSVDPSARSFALNAAYDVSDNIRADFEATWSRNERTDRYTASLVNLPYETNSLKLGVSADIAPGLLSAEIYSNAFEFGDLNDSSSVGALESRTTVGIVDLVTKLAPAHTVRIAGEYRRNEMAQGGGDLTYDVYALSGMWNWQATTALALTTAVRHDRLELRRSGAFVSPDFPFTNADYDQSFGEWSFNIGAVYRASERDTLRFSAARGVGSPSLAEYGFNVSSPTPPPGTTLFIAGDPSVTPTIAHNFEVGWDREIASINGRVRAALFWQQNENLRSFAAREEVVSVFPTVVIAVFPETIGDSQVHGVELAVDGSSGRFHWDAQYSWLSIDDALTVSPLGQANYERTSPEHVVTASLTWVGERLELGADARYTSATLQYGQGDVLVGLFPVDAYLQINARAAWRVNEGVQVELSGRNLLEDETQTVGLSPVERSVYLTLRADF